VICLLAELHGKISRSGSNLRTTSEGNLTGNVFGTLRYVPFKQLAKPLLLSSICAISEKTLRDVRNAINDVDIDFWGENIEFWPYDKEGELDVLLQFDSVVLGIEVKYKSPMSDQCDDMQYDIESNIGLSQKQLDRESRIVKRYANGRKAILLLLAKKQFAKDIIMETLASGNIAKGVKLCFVGWEDLLEALKDEYKKYPSNDFTGLIVSDLINLLTIKGFEQFHSFDEVDGLEVAVSGDGYYEFYESTTTLKDSISFNYDDNILKENFYEFANGK